MPPARYRSFNRSFAPTVRWAAAAVLLGSLLAPVLGLVVSPATGAGDARGTGQYTCTVEPSPAPASVSVDVLLEELPALVAAGEVLQPAGVVTLIFPDEVALVSQAMLATEAGLDKIDLALIVRSPSSPDGVRLEPRSVTPVPEEIGAPFAVRALVEFEPYTLPDDAAGELVLSMPSQPEPAVAEPGEPTSGVVGSAPVFGGVVVQDSPVAPTRAVSCGLEDEDSAAVVGRLVVVPATPPDTDATAAGENSEAGTADPTGSGAVLSPAGLPEQAPAPSAAAPVGDVDDGFEIAPTPGAILVPASVIGTPSALVPPATRRDGVFVPAWTLVVMALLLPVTCLAYAVRQHRRLVDARRFLRSPTAIPPSPAPPHPTSTDES